MLDFMKGMGETLKKYRALWKASKEHHDAQPQVERQGNELEFLPAAVEILETPASPLGRTVSISILLLFITAIAWAWFGKIDIEAVAQGRIIPKGQVKVVQTLDIGKVEELLVTEGEHVEKGQPLVKLDPTESEVDVQQINFEMVNALLNKLRLNLLLSVLDDTDVQTIHYQEELEKAYPELGSKVSPAQVLLQQQLLGRDLETYRSTVSSQAAQVQRQEATIKATRAEITRLETLKPLFDEQEKSIRSLLDKGHISHIEWLASKEQQVETSQNLLVQMNRLEEARAALVAVKNEGMRLNREFRRERLSQLQEYSTQAHTSELTLTKAMEREQNRYLLAPSDGTVQQLQVHTVGAVVQSAQTLMIIVPDDAVLEVEAMALNKDIGFLHEGQHVEIKVESFPYTRYGLIDGELRHLSRDSVEQEGVGRIYPMRIRLNTTRILVDDHWEKLQPGMAVTAEIKIGKRRVLEYFLAPFLRYQDESLKER
ncbi:HlyD family type I secretion periplasmic adaptor subunit [Parendozoicomonas sp. Alg238-R29]|uniref:HlyD family type I secretion periplasmic adaptor subunit n=1 Tax=Parendozoicomonas sp. Alg238-R29 TaxID=2993446 RepID=UPI00248ED176|nr:HlyD family type I secretion periplasmic adaptor subunit [Parendozoicomonas sp. Alg238-R29]